MSSPWKWLNESRHPAGMVPWVGIDMDDKTTPDAVNKSIKGRKRNIELFL